MSKTDQPQIERWRGVGRIKHRCRTCVHLHWSNTGQYTVDNGWQDLTEPIVHIPGCPGHLVKDKE